MSVRRFSTSGMLGYSSNLSSGSIFASSVPSTSAPGWNVLTVAGVNSTSVTLSWTAASNASGYILSNGFTRINVGNVTSYTWTGLRPNTLYTFAVSAYSSSGLYSGYSFASAFTTGFSAASGGTLTVVPNYNGTGQTWNVHRFTSNGTLTITSAASQFRILLVGGGSNGNGGAGSGGSGGFVYDNSTTNLSVESLSVVVGGAGTNSTLGALSSASGVRVGTGGNGSGSGGNGGSGAAGTTSNATGSSVVYGGGGGGGGYMNSGCGGGGGGAGGAGGGGGGGGVPGGCNCCTYSPAGAGGAGTANTGGGGGGGGRYDQGCCSGTTTGAGGAGGSGVVVVAYQIS